MAFVEVFQIPGMYIFLLVRVTVLLSADIKKQQQK